MAATTTQRVTVEEFSKLPEEYHELRHGEIVPMTAPIFKHYRIQSRLRKLLESVAPAGALVEIEFAFQVLNYNLRIADVALVSAERHAAIDPDSWLQGAPDLVVEVLSPSNTVSEMYDKEQLCLENGSREFWVVDPIRKKVRVSTPDGRTITHSTGQEIPLLLFGNAKVPVDAIFA